jgi:hypothetical protein
MPDLNAVKVQRVVALTLAVVHHGFSNFAEGSVPAGWQTTLTTAERFRNYINEGTVPTR